MLHLQAGKYVNANGLNIHYGEAGEGKPLIMLHGGTANLESWQAFVPLFAKHFRVIAPDTRGHGKTVNATNELSYPQLADDVVAFIKALKLEKPMIFGYSDGGQIALDLAIRYPDVCSAVGLGGTLYKFAPRYYDALKAMGFASAGQVDFAQMEQSDGGWAAYLKTAHPRDDEPDYWKRFMTQISTLWWTPRDYSEDELRQISVPTLIWMGDRDEGIGVEHAVAMYRSIPNAELAIIPNADHGGVFTEMYFAIVVDFFVRHT